jgi:hypothetical protein
VADFAAAYPETLGVKTLTRAFSWDGGALFDVRDEVTLLQPKTVEWHLQSDTPFEAIAGRYCNGKLGEPALEVAFLAPGNRKVEMGPAQVKSPGPPGAIETGPEEERGYRLRATAPAATAARFEVRLTVLDKR